MKKSINSFRGKYRFLSNFYEAPIEYNGILYKSTEYAYQCNKVKNKEDHDLILNELTPGRAKRLGANLPIKPEWNDQYKLKLMNNIVTIKFTTHLDLRKKLIETKDYTLIEGNTWNDTFWGVCNGKGSNYLGLILMNIREKLIHNKI
jgi:ribA/ribD-fused uncharacterized protein